MEEENKGQTYDPYGPNYVGPSNTGEAKPALAPWDYVLGAIASKPLIGGAIGKWGWDKSLEVGTNALFPDVEDSLLEQGMRTAKLNTAATASKFSRGMYNKVEEWFSKDFSLFNKKGRLNRFEDTISSNLQVSLTGPRDLDLYGASPSQFEEITDINKALTEEVARGGRRVKVGDYYYTIHKKKGENILTPYNKWYQQNVDPFRIPKDLEAKWRSHESGQQLDITESGGKRVDVQYGTKGKTREIPQTIKYDAGTVDEFKAWYKNLFDLQGQERELMQKLSVIAEKADLVPAKPKGKKFFEMDRSHIVPRSRGGSGLTFLEAWMANQKRGADWILDSDALQRAGIPRNWDELFNEWLAAKKSGGTIQTGLGPLDNINVDDYFAVERGTDLSVVSRRRKNIRNLVNRQIGNADTALLKGETGTIADDYKNMILESKGYDEFDDVILPNPKILDLGYAAENFEELIEMGEL